MRRALIATLLTLFAGSAVAQFAPPGRPFQSADPGLALGTQFDSLFVSCGTPINTTCPRQLEPLGRPALIHYVAAGGRSTDVCSATVYVLHPTPAGIRVIDLLRLVFGPNTADNVTLTLPHPLRLEADDAVAVSHAQGTCAILATLGIEYLD
jgi:hypothetical protein